MPWPGSFSSLGVSLASDHKATQGELDNVTMKKSLTSVRIAN